MSSFADLDWTINEWVKSTGSALGTEWAGRPARFFHVSGDLPFECFQVSIRIPEGGRTAVTARAIDTNDDTEAEMDRTWEGATSELDTLLATAIQTIDGWKLRVRNTANPPSHSNGS